MPKALLPPLGNESWDSIASTLGVPISEVASAKTVTDAVDTRQSYAQSICLRRQAGDHAALAFLFAVAGLGAFTGPFALTMAA